MKTRIKNIIFLLILLLIVELMAEGVLRLLHIPALEDETYFFGFSGCPNYFKKIKTENQQVEYTVNPEKDIAPATFAAYKRENEYRIFTLGGSATYGEPYGSEGAFSHWLEDRLQSMDSSTTYRVINCGRKGFGSLRVKNIFNEIVHYEPDLIVVYFGNNEDRDIYFHRREIAIESRPFFRTTKRILDHSYLFRMVFHLFFKKKITSHGAEGVHNIIDKDTFSKEIFAGQKDYLAQARKYLDVAYGGNWTSRLDSLHLSDAAEMDPATRELLASFQWHPRMKEIYSAVVRDMIKTCEKKHISILFVTRTQNLFYNRDARLLFERDNDGNNILRRLCGENQTPLAESLPALREGMKAEIGYNAFADRMHLKLRANQIVAKAIMDEMIRQDLVKNPKGKDLSVIGEQINAEQEKAAEIFPLNTFCLSKLGWEKLVCIKAAKDPLSVKEEIISLAEKAIALDPQNFEAYTLLGALYDSFGDEPNCEKIWMRMKKNFMGIK